MGWFSGIVREVVKEVKDETRLEREYIVNKIEQKFNDKLDKLEQINENVNKIKEHLKV